MNNNNVTTATNIPCRGAICNQALDLGTQLVVAECSSNEVDAVEQEVGLSSPEDATPQRHVPAFTQDWGLMMLG